MTAICFYITLFPAEWINELLQLQFPPFMEFPIIVVTLAVVDCILCLGIEYFIVDYLLTKKFKLGSYESNNEHIYHSVKIELDSCPGWPPICKHQPMITSSSLECMRKTEIDTEQFERQERVKTMSTKL